ncbi:MAG TPA: ribonuclease HII [Terriglobales bacterium]|nr:ribonuclease HII [Terriglobales bacterium]
MRKKSSKKIFLKKDGTPMSGAYAKMCLLKSLKCTQKFEKKAWAAGAKLIAGVDEVGRGCLFGPVVAAAVILESGYRIRGLRDSKLIPEETREALAQKVREHSVAISIAVVDVETIDRINIYHASRMAMLQAVAQLQPLPDHLLVDAMVIDFPSAQERMPQTKIIHGDALSMSIAAASIVAKVERDRMMREIAPQYPHYDLASNKGYSAPKHLAALREIGPSPLHRMSFAPVWTSQRLQDSLTFMTEEGEAVISGEVNVEEVLLAEQEGALGN